MTQELETIKEEAPKILNETSGGESYKELKDRLDKAETRLKERDKIDCNYLSRDLKTKVIAFIIDGSGVAITAGEKGHLPIPFNCDIESVTLLADASGSIVVDIWKDTYANFLPTDADSITASAPPTITTATKSQDTTLTGWTKAITKDDILAFNVDSCTTITRVTIYLKVKRRI